MNLLLPHKFFQRILLSKTLRLQLFAMLFCIGNTSYSQVTFSTTTLPTGMEFAGAGTLVQTPDINNDGLPDIIYTTASGGAITYLQNDGAGSFSTPSPNPFASYTSSSPAGTVFNTNTTVADFDGDGDVDIWARVSGAANDVYLRNDAGTYVTATLITGMEFTLANVTNVQVADINNDGFPDFFYNTAAGGAITYMQNNGGTSFSTPSPNPFASYTSSSPAGMITVVTSADVADFDGDGDLDIWGRVSGAANDVYLRNDAGTYVTATVLTGMEFTGASIGVGRVGDMNGDGLPDIFYNSAVAGALTYLQNTGGAFSTPSPNPFAAYTASTPTGVLTNSSTSVGDFDGDGDMDLWIRVTGAANDFYTTASGAAPSFTSTTPANNSSSVLIASNITLNFSENVFAGAGSFYIRLSSDNSIVETIPALSANVTGSGTTSIVIDPSSNLDPGTSYYITFDRTALADAQGLIAGHADVYYKMRVPERTSSFLQFTTEGTLPVTLTYFNAKAQEKNVLLQWATATEINSRDFSIQHSVDGREWNTIAVIGAAGNSSQAIQYSYIHNAASAGINYYRLLQTDIDGRFQYSAIRTATLASIQEIALYPNPAQTALWLKTTDDGLKKIAIYNMAGVRVYNQVHRGNAIQLSLPRLQRGVYQLTVSENGKNNTRTFMVQ